LLPYVLQLRQRFFHATRLDPASPETLLANAYYRYHIQRDYEGARVLFEQIHQQVPSSSEALAALTKAIREAGRSGPRCQREKGEYRPQHPRPFSSTGQHQRSLSTRCSEPDR
jgi:Tfp pilus assembly protein PilF